ncbi:hypothetical protein GGD83_000685 [Rhodoblastus sphagnicola]|uniref:hypothetical protein n=1 Tax=Rhodoblastus sphagnicola TaxID=333368 RepID=UPI0016173B29|nr:hypothetical protein [Rhodoblastus sphagnicola]MBB4196908.1 hypothetical protein [Rhodoblastus sphagnicola]
MTLAPIDGRSLAHSRRLRRVNPAACRLAPLLRLMLLVALGGALVSVALGSRGAQAAPVITLI